MKYDALLFDLDGTLLETLPDIVDAINDALKDNNLSYVFSVEEGKKLIGDGPVNFIKRALKYGGFAENLFDKVYASYIPQYKYHQGKNTYPFTGIADVLDKIKKLGYKVYVVTNKPEHLAIEILSKTLPNIHFDGIYGFMENRPFKPSKEFVDNVIATYGLENSSLLYIGDSHQDLEVARNGKMDCALVSWGYGNLTEELIKNANYYISSPNDLLKII